jgi:hypothetical protein
MSIPFLHLQSERWRRLDSNVGCRLDMIRKRPWQLRTMFLQRLVYNGELRMLDVKNRILSCERNGVIAHSLGVHELLSIC